MSITTFAEEARAKSKGKVKAPIVERWNKRVLPQGLHQRGRMGARAYLEAYGKSIAAPKVTELALCAESMGAKEMAAGFWEAAYNLTTGEVEVFHIDGEDKAAINNTPIQAGSATKSFEKLEGIPDHLQPGRIDTMQADDPDESKGQGHFICNANFIGQPKRDGNRNVAFGTEKATAHQSRSSSPLGMLRPEFEDALKAAAQELGPFILDGERYYLSITGSEHRTASQAAQANENAGKPTAEPIAVFGAFECLFINGKDLTEATKEERIQAAVYPVAIIHSHLPQGTCRIEAVPTYRTRQEKADLCAKQEKEGREGEVWTLANARYTGGKGYHSFRTKYTQERNCKIIGVKKSTAAGREIASFLLEDENGMPCGSVGGGFDAATGTALAEKHTKNPGSVIVKIRHQGRTETGALWHARYLEEVI